MPFAGRRILVLTNFFTEGHGGTPESVQLLARELATLGIAVDVVCRKGLLRDVQLRDVLPTANDDAVFSAEVPHIGRYAALFIAGSWNRQAPMFALSAILSGIPIAYAAKGCLCDIEFERVRDMRRVPYFLMVEWPLLAFSRRILFSSRIEQEASILPRWLWRRKAALLPEPFRGGGTIAAVVPRHSILTLGFLAEISPRKGLLELIDGFGHYLLSRLGASVQLKIAGQVRPGSAIYFEQCRALAQRNGAAAHIEWCGPVRGEQRRDFYRTLDIFVCPSRFESFGLTPLESLWQGTSVCAARAMGVMEYLAPDAPVLRLASLGREDVANAIAEMADNIEDWRNGAHAWQERHAMTRSNAAIALEFAHILLDARPA